MSLDESGLEEMLLKWFRETGYRVYDGPKLLKEQRGNNPRQVVLQDDLLSASMRLNPNVPERVLDEALATIENLPEPGLMARNRAFHKLLTRGLPVRWSDEEGEQADHLTFVDFQDPSRNRFAVANQLSVRGPHHTHRPDVVVYLNGLPLAVIELKSDTSEQADIWDAYNQLQTYKSNIDNLMTYNEVLVISDGLEARVGSLSASRERFMPWRTLNDEQDRPQLAYQLETVVRGFFRPDLWLDYLCHFILFEYDGAHFTKKIAGYHQFHAVRAAVRAAVIASARQSDDLRGLGLSQEEARALGQRKGGVVWHTQGSGKSISMACFAGKLLKRNEMNNPTLVVVTDRNDLDGQLFKTFSQAEELLGETPVQVDDRTQLRAMLAGRQAGGIFFTTIQKFSLAEDESRFPELSDRNNIVVISDEAHRSQYGFRAKLDQKSGRYTHGFAKHLRDALPQATFVGFTGTPLEESDKDTRAVFGEYVSIYDIQDAVDDKATVPIYFESRLAKLVLNKEIEAISREAEEVTEGEEDELKREGLLRVWSKLEKLAGSTQRLSELAEDLVAHFEKRKASMEGKAMIVCMSRDICVALFERLIALRPDWAGSRLGEGGNGTYNPNDGGLRIVMTGDAADAAELQPHRYSKRQKKTLEQRFKDPDDPLELVIVRDMWLTGFDAPCCHTMYVDKPMRGHNLMQAIARVNRVFREKPGGLVVDYIGIASNLKRALKTYTDGKGKGDPTTYVAEALTVLREKLSLVRKMLHDFDYSGYATSPRELLLPAANHILKQQDQPKRFFDQMAALSRAFALCCTTDQAQLARTEIAFLDAVRSVLVKHTSAGKRDDRRRQNGDLKQILDNAVAAVGVVDVLAMAGMQELDMGLLSEEFLAEVDALPEKHLAAALLERLLADQVRGRQVRNLMTQKRFGERLADTLRRYHNRLITVAQVVESLIGLARDLRDARSRGQELGLTPEEEAFYDALADNESAREQMKDTVLRALAVALTETLRENVKVDWHIRESQVSKLRNKVKELLRRFKYPPSGEKTAVELVLAQTEALGDSWADNLAPRTVLKPKRGQRTNRKPRPRAERPIPFPVATDPSEEERYTSHVPLVPLRIAAGPQAASTLDFADLDGVTHWVNLGKEIRDRVGQFVARIAGLSMAPKIPDGSLCLFRRGPIAGSREGRLLVFAHDQLADPEHGSNYTLKRYHSEKEPHPEGGFRHTKIELQPLNPSFEPIVVDEDMAADLRVIAEFREVLPDTPPKPAPDPVVLEEEQVAMDANLSPLVPDGSLIDNLSTIVRAWAERVAFPPECVEVVHHAYGLNGTPLQRHEDLALGLECGRDRVLRILEDTRAGLRQLLEGDGVDHAFLGEMARDEGRRIDELLAEQELSLLRETALCDYLAEHLERDLSQPAHRAAIWLLCETLGWPRRIAGTPHLEGQVFYCRFDAPFEELCRVMELVIQALMAETPLTSLALQIAIKRLDGKVDNDLIREAVSACPFLVYGEDGYSLDAQTPVIREPDEDSDIDSSEMVRISDPVLKTELEVALDLLNERTADMGMFKLGKLFEAGLKQYLQRAAEVGVYSNQITRSSYNTLAAMIDYVLENDRSLPRPYHLRLLKDKRNSYAHQHMVETDRKRLLRREVPFLVPLFLQYIREFHERHARLSDP